MPSRKSSAKEASVVDAAEANGYRKELCRTALAGSCSGFDRTEDMLPDEYVRWLDKENVRRNLGEESRCQRELGMDLSRKRKLILTMLKKKSEGKQEDVHRGLTFH